MPLGDTGVRIVAWKCSRVSQAQRIRRQCLRHSEGDTTCAFAFKPETRPQNHHGSVILAGAARVGCPKVTYCVPLRGIDAETDKRFTDSGSPADYRAVAAGFSPARAKAERRTAVRSSVHVRPAAGRRGRTWTSQSLCEWTSTGNEL